MHPGLYLPPTEAIILLIVLQYCNTVPVPITSASHCKFVPEFDWVSRSSARADGVGTDIFLLSQQQKKVSGIIGSRTLGHRPDPSSKRASEPSDMMHKEWTVLEYAVAQVSAGGQSATQGIEPSAGDRTRIRSEFQNHLTRCHVHPRTTECRRPKVVLNSATTIPGPTDRPGFVY